MSKAARVRLRLLDEKIAELYGGLDDIEVPLPRLAQTAFPVETVFIVENKITGLCLPQMAIPWLRTKRLIYWGGPGYPRVRLEQERISLSRFMLPE